MAVYFEGFEWNGFWEHSDWSRDQYEDAALTDTVVRLVEQRLGYRLPGAYVAMARLQNGGIPVRTNHRSPSKTTWAKDHIAISGIYSVGERKRYSLCGECGSKFWGDEWGYPAIGIYFADCPSAGHDMLCLDYRNCGPEGEPNVVHVDQEWDYRITPIAPSFESFIRGLQHDSAFPVE